MAHARRLADDPEPAPPEDRPQVVRPVRPELLEHAPEARRDLAEVELGVELNLGHEAVLLQRVLYGGLEPLAKRADVLHREREARREGTAAEAVEQVLALREGAVDGDALDAPRRALGGVPVLRGEQDRGGGGTSRPRGSP